MRLRGGPDNADRTEAAHHPGNADDRHQPFVTVE
jgi:hypothetical protein